MHDIEPYFRWRDRYMAEEDRQSPFFGRQYDEFKFTKKIYNYFIHPQWDEFGSATLYLKLLYVDYDDGYVIMELIGEWNDCLTNDIMFLKREIIDHLAQHRINKFILFCENVLNFHGSDDCYYEEWYDDVKENGGWICFLNTLVHVEEEMHATQLHHYVNFGHHYNEVNWRAHSPKTVFRLVEGLINNEIKKILY